MKKTMRKLMAFALAAIVLFTNVPNAFADTITSQDKLDKLVELNVLKGEGNGVDGTKTMTRYRSIVMMLRLQGLEDDMMAYDYEGKDSFADAEGQNGYQQKLMAYIKNTPELGVVGYPDGTFRPYQEITTKEYVKVLVDALGYDYTWETVAEVAAAIGLADSADDVNTTDDFKVFDFAGFTYDGLSMNGNGDDVTLGEKLGFPIVITEKDLAVESINANNLREMVVTFNKEVDEKTILDENFTVKLNGIKKEITATLSEDKSTVVLTAKGTGANFDNQKNYTVEISKVKDVKGNEITKTTQSAYVFDGSLPEVKEVTITGPKSIVIEFTEPVETKGTVKVTSGNSTIGVNSSSITEGTSKVSVELYSSLQDGKEYTFTIKSFIDYAGYGMIDNTTALTYNKNAEEITVSITKATQNYAVVEFNKPVKGLKKEFFYHTFTAWTAMGVYSDAEMITSVNTTTAYDKVYVKFADSAEQHPLPAGSTEVVIKDKVGTAKITDNWGNEFGGATLIAEVAVDEAAPVVDSLTVKTESTLEVKFDENVDFTKSNVEILDEDGKALSGVTVSGTTKGATYTINLGKSFAGKTINVIIKNVTDLALKANKLVSYTEQLTITDKTAPTVTNVTKKYITDGEQSLYVFFSEEVNDTALDINNYYLQDGSNLIKALAGNVEFYDNNKTVRIPLSDEEKALVEGGYQLVIRNVQDVYENVLIGHITSSIKDYNDNANKASVAKAEVTAKDTVIITFDQFLPTIEASAFTIGGKTPAGMDISTNSDGNSVVTLITSDDNQYEADLSNKATNVVAVTGSTSTLANVFGVAAADNATVTLTDKINPTLSIQTDNETNNVFIVDHNGDDIADVVVLRYDEAINKNTVSSLTYNLDNKLVIDNAYVIADSEITDAADHSDAKVLAGALSVDGTEAEGNGHYVVLVLNTIDADGELRVANTELAPQVTQVLNIFDSVGNVLESSDDAIESINTLN